MTPDILSPVFNRSVEERIDYCKKGLRQAFVSQLPKINEALNNIAEAQRMIESGQKMVIEADKKIAETDREIELAKQGFREQEQKNQQHDQKIQQHDQKIQQLDKDIERIVTKRFLKIFNVQGEKPVEEIDNLFKKYLADGSFVVIEDPNNAHVKIKSTKPLIQYIKDHPGTKLCDLRAFKAEVYDLPTLADYLKDSGVSVKLIALNNGVSSEGKQSLAEAIKARNGEPESPICWIKRSPN